MARSENPLFDATAHYQEVAEKAIRQMYPTVKASDPRTAENVQAYMNREATHVSFVMPSRFSEDIIREVVIEAINHAMDETDPAYSEHGAEHKVFPEAGQRLINHLTEVPSQVGVQRTYDIFRDKLNGELRVEKYALSTPWQKRQMPRPLYVEVGAQIHLLLEDMKRKSQDITEDNLDKRRKKIVKRIAVEIGVDFAILVGLCSGMSSNEVLDFFTDARDIEARPTRSRQIDYKNIAQIERLLRPNKSMALTFDSENQAAAAALVQDNRAWGHAPEKVWTNYPSELLVSSLAVFGGATYAMARIVDNKTPDFRYPARAFFVDKQSGVATSEIITMYNVYQLVNTSLVTDLDRFTSLFKKS